MKEQELPSCNLACMAPDGIQFKCKKRKANKPILTLTLYVVWISEGVGHLTNHKCPKRVANGAACCAPSHDWRKLPLAADYDALRVDGGERCSIVGRAHNGW